MRASARTKSAQGMPQRREFYQGARVLEMPDGAGGAVLRFGEDVNLGESATEHLTCKRDAQFLD